MQSEEGRSGPSAERGAPVLGTAEPSAPALHGEAESTGLPLPDVPADAPRTKRTGVAVMCPATPVRFRKSGSYLALRMPSVTMPTLVTPAPVAASMMATISP